jgi:hypothetical protein
MAPTVNARAAVIHSSLPLQTDAYPSPNRLYFTHKSISPQNKHHWSSPVAPENRKRQNPQSAIRRFCTYKGHGKENPSFIPTISPPCPAPHPANLDSGEAPSKSTRTPSPAAAIPQNRPRAAVVPGWPEREQELLRPPSLLSRLPLGPTLEQMFQAPPAMASTPSSPVPGVSVPAPTPASPPPLLAAAASAPMPASPPSPGLVRGLSYPREAMAPTWGAAFSALPLLAATAPSAVNGLGALQLPSSAPPRFEQQPASRGDSPDFSVTQRAARATRSFKDVWLVE